MKIIIRTVAANPPKTTAWGAPIRAQASIAITASMLFGIYIITVFDVFPSYKHPYFVKTPFIIFYSYYYFYCYYFLCFH